ncbi:putative MFS transporter superfamily [Helianthus annuus]|nr:putative MFS transporter superfamily [Helianthus annuus]
MSLEIHNSNCSNKKYIFFMFFRVIFNTIFGFSFNYWMAIITRFLLGFLNGILGTIKAYACEIFPQEYQALGLSAVRNESRKFMMFIISHSYFT